MRDTRLKALPEIRINLGNAAAWIVGAGRFLNEWFSYTGEPSLLDLENAKRWAQQAKKLIDEAIADLDGLIQDRTMLLKNGSFIGPTDLNGIDPEYEAAVADLRPLFGVPQDGPGYGEEPWWM